MPKRPEAITLPPEVSEQLVEAVKALRSAAQLIRARNHRGDDPALRQVVMWERVAIGIEQTILMSSE